MEVDGQPTPDLDAFLKVVAGRPDRSSVRLRTLTWNNVPEVITLKLDRHYWPTSEIVRTPRLGPACWTERATGCTGRFEADGRLVEWADGKVVRASQAELEAAVDALRDGELVAFPTETVYGLGANASNPAAVRKVFELKDRPPSHPVIVHIDQRRSTCGAGCASCRRRPRSWPRPSGRAR